MPNSQKVNPQPELEPKDAAVPSASPLGCWCASWYSCFKDASKEPQVDDAIEMRRVESEKTECFTPKRLLIIDDSRVVRKLLSLGFRKVYPGMVQIDLAANSAEADSFLAGDGCQKYDMICFDYELGLDACETGVGIFGRHLVRVLDAANGCRVVFPRVVFNTSTPNPCVDELVNKGFENYVAAVCVKTNAAGDAKGLVAKALTFDRFISTLELSSGATTYNGDSSVSYLHG
jgi:hypothetical protein